MSALEPRAAQGPDPAAVLRSRERIERLRGEVAAFERLLASLVTTLEARVPGTLRHGARVSRIATAIGREVGLSEESLERMQRGAVLHDLGMLVLPPKFLTKASLARPGRLDEFQAHPVLGYTLLKGVPTLEPILPFVHRHHERLDGSGFPDGLRGREIPLAVQVVSISDAFDELTSSGPPRLRLSRASAIETIREEARRGRWDPALAGLLERAAPGVSPARPPSPASPPRGHDPSAPARSSRGGTRRRIRSRRERRGRP